MVGFAELGLLFVGAAWFVQVFSFGKKEVKLNKQFVLLYVLGSALVLLDGIMNGAKVSSLLNLVALLGSMIVLFKMK